MKLRKLLLLVAGGATILLTIGLITVQGINGLLQSRAQARVQLSLANRACVDRIDAVLQTAKTQAHLLAQAEAPALLQLSATAPQASQDSVAAQFAPKSTLWVPQGAGTHIMLLNADGVAVYATQKQLVGERVLLDKKIGETAQQGNALLTPRQERFFAGGEQGIAVLQPLMKQGVYEGCVMIVLELSMLQEIVQEIGEVMGGSVALFDGYGKVISSRGETPYSTLLELMNKSNFRSFMDTKQPFSFRMHGTKYIATYVSLKSANWNVLCTMSPAERSLGLSWHLLPLLAVIAAAALLVLGLNKALCRSYSEPMALLQESIKSIEAGDYSHNVPHLGKQELGDVGEAFNAMLARIRRDHTELVIKEARHRIVNEQSNSIIFEYNIEADTVQCSPNGRMLANYPVCMAHFPDTLIESDCVNASEGKQLKALFCEMKHGRKQGEFELQLRTYNNKWCWFHLQLSNILDETSLKPLRVVGKLTDIDESKREAQHLAYKAERDALTGIYNKETTHSYIVQRLANREHSRISALFVADLDNFKRVNDGYGHQKGDEVLAQVAQILASCMASIDIVGRMGGDEFMLMMGDVKNVNDVERMAAAIVEEVRTVVLDAEKGDFMSLSMGIALCPQDGITYQQLYAHADNAAYAAKRSGKNDYAFYRGDE